VAMSALTDHVDEPPPPSAAPFFFEPDPLALAMCMAVGPPALVVSFDPMLEELAAVLAMSGALEAISLRTAEPSMAGNDATTGFTELTMAMAQEPPQLTPPASEVAPVEVTSRPSEMETATRDGSPQPLEHESALLTPPREGQPGVASGDETPSPREAARRLAQFLDKVRVVWEPPLIASPPWQRTPVRRPPPIRPRSRQIAAQPLTYIPAFRRDEVLLNQRLGIAPPTAPVSPAPKGILDSLRSGTLSSSQVEALDVLFPAYNGTRVRPLPGGPVGRGDERILVDLFM
jgi:hypothetical protein